MGRGSGESIAIHLGDMIWAVIDSFKDKNRRSAPLAYLDGMGVLPGQVQSIVATHWHDDHVEGISQLYEWATNADIYFPFVKTYKELNTYIEANLGAAVGQITNGVEELSKITAIKIGQRRRAPRHCQADSVVARNRRLGAQDIVLTALSPSPKDCDSFLIDLAARRDAADLERRLTATKPNDISIAAWLQFEQDAVLLGADVENRADAERGWNAIIASQQRPGGQASLYKVAHHGSSNAHHPGIWTDLLATQPVSALAPYNQGVGIPKAADVARILALSGEAYSTNATPFRKYRDGTPIVRTALEADRLKIQAGFLETGIVRMRHGIGTSGPWEVSTHGGAVHLSNFVPRD